MKTLKVILALISAVVGISALATGVIQIVTQTPQETYYAATPLCIQLGSVKSAADGTVTQAFPVAYNAAAPQVFLSAPAGITNAYVSTLTKTNFIITGLAGAGTNYGWVSIGAP